MPFFHVDADEPEVPGAASRYLINSQQPTMLRIPELKLQDAC